MDNVKFRKKIHNLDVRFVKPLISPSEKFPKRSLTAVIFESLGPPLGKKNS